jgi:methionyl aminopeptidase
MSIAKASELEGMRRVSEAVSAALRLMREHAQPGMNAQELDEYGGRVLREYGARSAPRLAYGFPGHTCISVNHEIAHGVPSPAKILREGDLVNIDVSAELDGFWADNGASLVLGEDLRQHQALVDASQSILRKAIEHIKASVRIAEIGRLIETEAKKLGYKTIRNLCGHGIGRGLHEEPHEIVNYHDRLNFKRFRKNAVVAIETFISTRSTQARTTKDGWTLTGNKGGFVAQHEHTIVITDGQPIILTEKNGIWD